MPDRGLICPECGENVRVRDHHHFAAHGIRLSSWLCPFCEYSRSSDRGHDVRKHINSVHGGRGEPKPRFTQVESSRAQLQQQQQQSRRHHPSRSPERKRGRESRPVSHCTTSRRRQPASASSGSRASTSKDSSHVSHGSHSRSRQAQQGLPLFLF